MSVHRGGLVLGGGAFLGGWLVLGACLVLGGVPGGDPPRTATAAGGTHPTGMLSCTLIVFLYVPQNSVSITKSDQNRFKKKYHIFRRLNSQLKCRILQETFKLQ